MNPLSSSLQEAGDEIRPLEFNKLYWVQCKGYRCLARLDRQGEWHTVATGKTINEVIRVYAE